MFEFSDKYLKDLIQGIYDGSITPRELPENLYYAIADYLKRALYKGFGGNLGDFEPDSTDLELLTELRENVYMFSAAKTFQQVSDMAEVLSEVDNFKDFEDHAQEIFDEYNDTWLNTEYKTAVGQAQNAAKWNEIENNKKVLPNLRYSAIEDANTSEICAPLDGICLPVDDPFWGNYMPLNHFNCRCIVESVGADEELSSDDDVDDAKGKADEDMQDLFKMNSGKDRVIFSDEHPYFEVSKQDRDYARENFNLPIPVED